MTTAVSYVRERAAEARAASRRLATLSSAAKDEAILRIAALLESDPGELRAANERDLAAGQEAALDPYVLDRLVLKPAAVAADTRAVAALPDPIGESFDARTLPNGLRIARRRVPLGVVAAIYESRPNVTVDITALALKSGNAVVLRGGKEARQTNAALGDLIQRALRGSAIPPAAVQVIADPARGHIDDLLQAHDLIDLVVPRGGAGLIDYVRRHATMPVVAHGEAVVQIYVDRAADLEMALAIVDNAKTRRYSICNAVDTLLVHSAVAGRFLPRLAQHWSGRVTFLADDRAIPLLAAPGTTVERADAGTWKTEHLALRLGVRVVDSLDDALAHIEQHGSHHSDAIVSEDYSAANRFLDEVDSAAVYVNASTQFTDGAQFGLGAEIGISTQKMHARGPMGLRELTSYKWTILGKGQVRPL